jgi:hypothetical protein
LARENRADGASNFDLILCFMRQFFALSWMRIRQAFRGNSAFAHDWQWAFGDPLTALLGPGVLAFVVGVAAWTTGWGVLDAFLVAATTFVTTWLVAFVVRLISLTSEVNHFEERQAGNRKTWTVGDRREQSCGRCTRRVSGYEMKARALKRLMSLHGLRVIINGMQPSFTARRSTPLSYKHLLDPIDKIAPRNQETVRANSRTHCPECFGYVRGA